MEIKYDVLLYIQKYYLYNILKNEIKELILTMQMKFKEFKYININPL